MSLGSSSDSLETDRSKLSSTTQREKLLISENEDVILRKDQTPDSGCFGDDEDWEAVCFDENSIERLPSKTDEPMKNLARAIKAISLESITSGISSGSCASEDRLDLLRCVTSYSNVGSRPPADTVCHSKRRVKSAVVSKSSDGNKFVKKKCSFSSDSVSALEKCHDQERCKSVSMATAPTEDGACYSDSCENTTSCNSNTGIPSRKQSVTIASEDSNGVKLGTSNKELKRTDSKYDPTLEKSKTFLHGQGKTFSRANEYLTPARPGLQKLQVSYTQTNTENNYKKIFYDLVKTAHRQNIIVTESVRNLERRLFSRRSDPHRATSYFEHKGLRDPSKSHRKKMARTTADKIKERKEKIKQTSDEIKIGYIPREQTIVLPGPEDIERLRSCRYLRVNPNIEDT